MMLQAVVRRRGTNHAGWQFLPVAAFAGITAVAVGAAIAYSPFVAFGLVLILLVAVCRSRETTVALWLGVRVLMFSGYVPLLLGELMLIVITIVAVARRGFAGQGLRAPRSPLLWLLLLGLVGLNLAYFGFDIESRDYAIEIFVENALLIALIANTESRWSRDGAVSAVSVILAGVGGVAALEWATGRVLLQNQARTAYEPLAALHTFEGVGRLGSVLLNPDYMAIAMVLGFVVWAGIAVELGGLGRWIAALVATALLGVALLTVSRSVFLGAPVGLGVLTYFAISKRLISFGHVALAVAGGSAALFLALTLLPNAWLRVTTAPTDPLRVGAYETALQIIAVHPLEGLGAGWNRYLALAEQYRVSEQYRPLSHPHNSLLELAAMLGLPVALVVVLLIGKVFGAGLHTRKDAAVSAIPLAGVAAMVAMSVAGQSITVPVLSNVFWAMWAVAGQRSRDPQRAAHPEPIVDPGLKPVAALKGSQVDAVTS